MIKSAITKAYYNNQALLDGIVVITAIAAALFAVGFISVNVGGM